MSNSPILGINTCDNCLQNGNVTKYNFHIPHLIHLSNDTFPATPLPRLIDKS